MKAFLCLLAGVFALLQGYSREIPVLDPEDPQFAWMDERIAQDFAQVNKHISWKEYRSDLQLHKNADRLLRFRVINNEVRGPPCACYNMLAYLCRTYGLPDLDFLYWNQDGLTQTPKGHTPILTGIRRMGVENTILFGLVWIFDISNPSGPLNSAIQEIDDYYPFMDWSGRENKAFWRGAATDIWSGSGPYSIKNWTKHARGRAVALSLQYPDYVDAAFTFFHPFCCEDQDVGREQLEKTTPLSKPVSIREHLKYKYQLQIMGIIGNFPRDVWQLYSESVSFRHSYIDEVYWSHLIEPWKHYVPIKCSMDDLIEKIEFARAHDEEMQEIAKEGRLFASTHCMPEHIALYCYKVLLRYAQIMEAPQEDPPDAQSPQKKRLKHKG